MNNVVKTGYVKIVSGGKITNILSYEQLALSKVLRIAATRRNGQVNAKALCCCRTDDPPELVFNDDGTMILTGNSKHTKECDQYRSQIKKFIENSALSAELNRSDPLPVDFSWSPSRAGRFDIIKSEDLRFRTAFSFSSWVAYNNIATFSYRFSGMPEKKLKDDSNHTSDFYFRISSKRIRNVNDSNRDHDMLFTDDQIFDHTVPGQQNIFYGRVIWSSSFNPDSKSKDFAHLRCRNERGHEVSFRVPLKPFMDAYQELPVHTGEVYKDNVWICGFVKKQKLKKTDDMPKGMGLGGIDPTKTTIHSDVSDDYIVKTMRFGRLFNCNDIGMIVFTKEEFETSNYLLGGGNPLYRPVALSTAYGNRIHFFNPNGEDISIENFKKGASQ